jgi:FkbM family methyltransferase
MKRLIKSDSNCVDVGCHKGEILEQILKLAPKGKHFAFEPIPSYYQKLKENYGEKATIFPFALSFKEGFSSFQFVKNAPAYSGLQQRRYDTKTPDIEEITVEMKTLDSLIPEGIKIDFIKIDVEGGEFDVLKGAEKLLKRDKPTVVFECGLGASDFYGATAQDLFNFLTDEIGLQIFLLHTFIKGGKALSKAEFEDFFTTNEEYYFIAHFSKI